MFLLPNVIQVLALVDGHADLLQCLAPAVVPEQPLPAVEDGIRLVAGVVVPLAGTRSHDGVGRVALPGGDAVARTGDADLGVVDVPKTDVEHQVPAPAPFHLAASNPVLLPGDRVVAGEDGVLLVLGPRQWRGVGSWVNSGISEPQEDLQTWTAKGFSRRLRSSDCHALFRGWGRIYLASGLTSTRCTR
ncbi:MAG TPA: hypothetical protein VJY33_22065 [Isosphaeraceae bacterium]|nr:hypothetical protein [Isosphaeraceae bacterium]